MNKKEQAAFDEAVTDMYAARALRWQDDKPEPMTVGEILAEFGSGENIREFPTDYNPSLSYRAFVGWSYNDHTGDVYRVAVNQYHSTHARVYDNGTASSWSRSGVSVYRTQADAFRALRYDLTVKYARSLAKIDAQIKAVVE